MFLEKKHCTSLSFTLTVLLRALSVIRQTRSAALGLASERREKFLEIYEGLPRNEQVEWMKQEALDKMERNEKWELENSELICSHIGDMLNLS